MVCLSLPQICIADQQISLYREAGGRGSKEHVCTGSPVYVYMYIEPATSRNFATNYNTAPHDSLQYIAVPAAQVLVVSPCDAGAGW